jgi:DNA-binding MarR family transcriptional regulator
VSTPNAAARPTSPAYDLEVYTGYLIRRAQQAHVAVWQREVSGDVSSPQFGVLSSLIEHPGASQADLCAVLDLDRSTIADIVLRLLRRGLVSRERHTDDRRRNTLYLSESGRQEYLRLLPRVARVDEALTHGLTVTERDDLRSLLTKLLNGPTNPWAREDA